MNTQPHNGSSSSATVTVLIAAYNAAPFLHRSVQSALEQTVPPFEILIVDDGSNDDTLAVARRLGETNPSIHVIALPENGGPSRARNAGLDAAQGDWIAILDADDRFTADHLEILMGIATKNDADIVAGNFAYYSLQQDRLYPSGIPVNETCELADIYRFTKGARAYEQEADWGLLQPIFNKEFLNRNALRYATKSRHGEDFLLMMHALLANARFIFSHKIGYFYTDLHSGHSRTQPNFDIMWVHSNELLNHPRVAKDARLSKLLRQRMYAIKRLIAEIRFDHYRQTHDNAALIKSIFTDAYIFWETLRRIAGKCRGLMARLG